MSLTRDAKITKMAFDRYNINREMIVTERKPP